MRSKDFESGRSILADYISGGDLFTHLDRRRQFKEEEVRIYIAEIVIGIEKLHQLGIIYRDLKLENVLLDAEGHIVLTDFGLAKQLTKESNGRSYTFCGTIEYMAPEMISRNGHTFSVDWWTVGVLCFEMSAGSSMFVWDLERDTAEVISGRILTDSPTMPNNIPREAGDLIKKLIEKDPAQRLGTHGSDEIKSHPFFKNINWTQLANKEIPAPFKPCVNHAADTSNFSNEYTQMDINDSNLEVLEPPSNHEKLFRGK